MKDKKLIIYFALIAVLFIGLVMVESNKKEPADWTPTFINTDKEPYGTYILYDLLKDVFPGRDIRTTRLAIFNELRYVSEESDISATDGQEDIGTAYEKRYLRTYDDPQSYIFINTTFGSDPDIPVFWQKETKNYGADMLDIQNLLAFAEDGNNIFIAAEKISPLLLDSLDLKIEADWSGSDTTYVFNDLKRKAYSYTSTDGALRYFTKKDSSQINMRTLAQSKTEKKPVFIKIKYGNGAIYLNTLPVAFSNVELLNTDKYDFAFICLSYLPKDNDIIWDEYQKQGRIGQESVFREVWSHPAMLWAYYIVLATGLLFVLFRSKRMQRVIPVIEPPKNTSLEFLDTISNLYYQREAYESIVRKRHNHFLDLIRTRYYLHTETINDEFINNLSMKSGVDKDIIEYIFVLHEKINNSYDISNQLLLQYNEKLEEFYRNMK